MPQMDLKKADFFLLFFAFDFESPDLRNLQFKNVKLNLKFVILELWVGDLLSFDNVPKMVL